jgi:uncharacterized Rmd1/YagE family protein
LEREFIAGTQENILLMSAATICIGNKFNLQHCYSVLVHIRTAITWIYSVPSWSQPIIYIFP